MSTELTITYCGCTKIIYVPIGNDSGETKVLWGRVFQISRKAIDHIGIALSVGDRILNNWHPNGETFITEGEYTNALGDGDEQNPENYTFISTSGEPLPIPDEEEE